MEEFTGGRGTWGRQDLAGIDAAWACSPLWLRRNLPTSQAVKSVTCSVEITIFLTIHCVRGTLASALGASIK
jgi:hypothetical protein